MGTKSHDNLGHDQSAVRDTALQLNKLIADVTAIRTAFVATLAKLDADAGVTDANYAALETPAAITAVTITGDGDVALT